MSTTLGEMVVRIDGEMRRSRTIDSEIKAGINYVLNQLEKRATHVTERRNAYLALIVGQVWYGAFSEAPPAAVDDDSAEISWSLEEPAYGGPVSSLIEIDDVMHVDTSMNWTPVSQHVTLQEFNRERRSPATARIPRFICRYAQNIGFWPAPTHADAIYIFGRFKPSRPVNDQDTNAYFEEAEDLVVEMAKTYVYRTHLRDYEAATVAGETAQMLLNNLLAEGNKRGRTNRLRASW